MSNVDTINRLAKDIAERFGSDINAASEKATVIISSHNLNHTVDVCPRIALLENGVIIRDIRNENNSAEQELEAYFNVGVEEEAVVEETVVEAAVEEITEKEDKTVEEKNSEA